MDTKQTSRRNLLKYSAIGAAVLPLTSLFGKAIGKTKTGKVEKPIVLSTWNFGVAANAEAWKVLSAGGRALDAVEAGVRVPEADGKNNSVGYGGLPDRDGRVTLDACIMDEHGNCGSVASLENV